MNASIKDAETDYPIHELLIRRWSPYCFDGRTVAPRDLSICLEAARWAASSFNEQPWSFVVATRDESAGFEKLLSCLMELNQKWARDSGALLLTVIRRTFTRNGKPNRVALHDLGLAMGNLTVQATALGISVHQMAGVDLEAARSQFGIPETHEPATAVALGYPADPAGVTSELAVRDQSPRTRKPLGEFVFRGAWGQTGEASR